MTVGAVGPASPPKITASQSPLEPAFHFYTSIIQTALSLSGSLISVITEGPPGTHGSQRRDYCQENFQSGVVMARGRTLIQILKKRGEGRARSRKITPASPDVQ